MKKRYDKISFKNDGLDQKGIQELNSKKSNGREIKKITVISWPWWVYSGEV